MNNDLISRGALQAVFEKECVGECGCCKHIKHDPEGCALIDDAPAVILTPLTWDEAMCDDAFLEIKDCEFIDAALNLFACGTVDGSLKDGFIYYETHNHDELKLLEIDYGKKWRCWSRRPTDEERAAAKWEVE